MEADDSKSKWVLLSNKEPWQKINASCVGVPLLMLSIHVVTTATTVLFFSKNARGYFWLSGWGNYWLCTTSYFLSSNLCIFWSFFLKEITHSCLKWTVYCLCNFNWVMWSPLRLQVLLSLKGFLAWSYLRMVFLYRGIASCWRTAFINRMLHTAIISSKWNAFMVWMWEKKPCILVFGLNGQCVT